MAGSAPLAGGLVAGSTTQALVNASRLLIGQCIEGITVHEDTMRAHTESSPAMVTPLNAYVGHEAAAEWPRMPSPTAPRSGRPVIPMGVVGRGEVTEEQLEAG